jgi:hypothetical protein
MTATKFVTFEDLCTMKFGTTLINPEGKIFVVRGDYLYNQTDDVKIDYLDIDCPLKDMELTPMELEDMETRFEALVARITKKMIDAGLTKNFIDVYLDTEQLWIDFQECEVDTPFGELFEDFGIIA